MRICPSERLEAEFEEKTPRKQGKRFPHKKVDVSKIYVMGRETPRMPLCGDGTVIPACSNQGAALYSERLKHSYITF